MKKVILIIVTSILISSGYSQSWTFSNRLVGTDDITVIESANDSEGNVYVFGYFYGTLLPDIDSSFTSLGNRDYFVIKFLTDGTIDWVRQLGGPSLEYIGGGISITSDDEVFITGGYREYLKYTPTDSIISTGGFDIFLSKYDIHGEIIWIKNIGEGLSNQRPTALNVDNNGDVFVGGFFNDSISINNDSTLYSPNALVNFFYSKFLNNTGDLIWAKQVIALNNSLSGRIRTIEPFNEGIYITGFYADSIVFQEDTVVSYSSNYDAFVMKTDLTGNPDWIRTIGGEGYEYAYSLVIDQSNNAYVVGNYESESNPLFVESAENVTVEYSLTKGGNDYMILKYSVEGNLIWFNSIGGKGNDRLFDAQFLGNEIVVSGTFSDTLHWGGIELRTDGINDQDMLTGYLDLDGNYRSANSYGGRNSSWEEAWSIFNSGINTLTTMRSNSDLLVLGDSIYTSSTGKYYIVLGVIGCAPISIDQVVTLNVETCFADSTGSIQILASGGFGAPWQYSIDNGLNYEPLAYFAELPAGDYPIVVIDAENCAQTGPTETVTQPEALSLELITEEFTGDSMINIVVAAYGGTPPYTFTLQPNGIVQAFGDFNVKWSEPGYYVVEVNDIRNCGPVVTDTLNTSNGIDLFAPGVKLYPNPTSGIITVEVPFQGSACTLEVLNLTGQVMISRQVYSNGISINETIDLSDLSKGMYMIRVDGQTLKSGVVVN